MKHAGEPFFTTKNPTANTGLGLSSVREFVQNCGGSSSFSPSWRAAMSISAQPSPNRNCDFEADNKLLLG